MTSMRSMAIILSGASALALSGGTALAQQRNFDLPEGRAADVLPSFALQSGLQIIAPVSYTHLTLPTTPYV